MLIKIFKGYINETQDTYGIERSVSNFIRGVKVIDIKQSVCTSTKQDGLYFITITVVYEPK